MENMAYYLKHRYPVARIFIGTEEGYKRMCNIFHPLFVSGYYDEQEEKNHILRQRTCGIENEKGYPGNYAINIIDDASDDPKVYKTKVMRGLFKLGSQHWSQLLMVGSQYAIDMPPDVRKSVSYVAIFREPEEIERKKLYNNFGGLAGSYENFCDLMDQLTGDFTCLIFKKRTQSNNMEENIFYYKTRKLKNWKFGCKEYREWGNKRYDSEYIEEIVM
uniref:Packaging ATPase n=1 Tax=Marseillevirus LCMAC102 TaxID=2506603 RepID=A0A481YUW2_9VIRU|nr:MAG: packaging ATPase [Marseillevirus LCMAC102]